MRACSGSLKISQASPLEDFAITAQNRSPPRLIILDSSARSLLPRVVAHREELKVRLVIAQTASNTEFVFTSTDTRMDEHAEGLPPRSKLAREEV